jgi:two-component system OmpR family sensor kinase
VRPRLGVGIRLTAALLLVLSGAFAIVYMAVVPSLERRLVDNRVEQLERSARNLRTGVPDLFFRETWVERTSRQLNARVVLYEYFTPPSQFTESDVTPQVDSGQRSDAVKDDPYAERTAKTFRLESGTVERGGRLFAEAAIPIEEQGPFLLLSSPVQDSLEAVDFVERTILIASLLAFGAALLVGFTGASFFAQRIRRLERAADRIAAGRFDEPIVDARTDELGELARAFERMRERLAGLDHARREFIANASHELRTPIFSLGGHLELLDDELLDEDTRRAFVGEMRAQVDRLTKLTSELLDLSRLDSGRLRVEREPVDLTETVRLVTGELGLLAQGSEHELRAETNGSVWATGDGQRVLQVARSLVENALRHTPPGTSVGIRALETRDAAELVVEDDGPGIPPEHRPHVFERFYRVDGAMASGSGLGLAIARELAELMGGSLELSFAEGRTRFTLRLPASETFPRENELAAPAVST